MRTTRRSARGFTLVELAIVVVIILVLGALAFAALQRARPRATFDGVASQVHALVHGARLHALASGATVYVIVFPSYRGAGSQGRIVVMQDAQPPALSFVDSKADLNLDNYKPETPGFPLHAAGAPDTDDGKVLDTLDLPQGVSFGPATGLGVASPAFPYSSIATNVACSFCGADRGAIAFDARGRATFYSAAGAQAGDTNGASFSIYAPDLGTASDPAVSTLVITRITGALRTFRHG